MKLRFAEFKGLAPKFPDTKLPLGFAREALNFRNDRGKVEPLKGVTVQASAVAGTAKFLEQFDDSNWVFSDSELQMVDAPRVNDPYDYKVYVGGAYPKYTGNSQLVSNPFPTLGGFRLGLPTPTAPTVTIAGDLPDPATDMSLFDPIETYYYVSMVDAHGRESVLSPPSSLISFYPEFEESGEPKSQQVNILLGGFISGEYNISLGTYRIYRIFNGDIRYVGEADKSAANFIDSVPDLNLGEVAPNLEWDAPPDDDDALNPDGPLSCIALMPNDFLVGGAGHNLCFSEVGVEYAWPIKYRQYLPSPITNVAVVGTTTLVLTQDKPYVAVGSDPAAMSVDVLPSNEGCISKRSVVDMGEFIVYASKGGLCSFDGSSIDVVTSDIMTEDEWASYDPATIHAYYYQGKYIGFYGDGTGGFMYSKSGGSSSFIKLDFYAHAGWADIENEALYLAVGSQIQKFDDSDSTSLTMKWTSAHHRVSHATNFTYGMVEAESYPVVLKTHAILADGSTRTFIKTVSNPQPFYLDSGFTAMYWSVTVEGTPKVLGIVLAHSIEELLNE